MAAASAGAIQAGFLSDTISPSTSQLQQQHHSVESSFKNQRAHLFDSQQLTSHHLQGQKHQNNASTLQSHQQHCVHYVTQRANSENYLSVKRLQIINNSPNLPPGWRRQLNDGEIVYFSPSGAGLRKIEQIKDYLLSGDTCKCGLPCPFRPEMFFEFNPLIPNLPLSLKNESEHPTYCLHHARFTEQQNLLSRDTQPTNFNHCLSSNQKVNQESVSYSEKHNSSESHVESITVSQTPPWRKNSILNQQQQQQSPPVVTQKPESANISVYINGRVPPLPQHQLLQSQPPWQEETQKRRNNSKRRPNFKEDPTGYLDQQTAILNNSILNVHSPESQQENKLNQSQVADRQSLMHNGNKNPSSPTRVNILSNLNFHDSTSDDSNQRIGNQKTSVMQQNQNMYIEQQVDSNINVSKNQIIGSNGQQMRIFNNAQQPIVHTNSKDFHVNAVNNSPSSIHTHKNSLSGSNSKHSVKRTPNKSNTPQQVQIQDKQGHFQPIKQLKQSQQLSSLDHIDQHQQQQQQQPQSITMSQTDQEINELNGKNEDSNYQMSLPIGVTHLLNGVVQVHHNCDINQVKTQPPISSQTILIKSTTTRMGNQIAKLKTKKQYILSGTRQNMMEYNVSVAQESPVSSSTTMKNIKTDTILPVIDKGPAQVEAISTSHESPPISSADTSHSPDLTTFLSKESMKLTTNQSNVFIAGQTIGKNTITSVVAGKTMTSTTNTGQPSSMAQNDKHRSMENIIQMHKNGIFNYADGNSLNNQNVRNTNTLKTLKIPFTRNGILKSVKTIHENKNHSNHIQTVSANIKIAQSNRTTHSINVPESVSLPPTTSQTSLSDIQQQQPTNQIIMTSSGCQILVMPTQNSKTINPIIIGQSANTNTLVVNSSTGQPNVVINTPNGHMIGNDLMQSINKNGTTHPNIIQNASNNVVIQSPNVMPTGNQSLIQSTSNVLTTNNGNVLSNNNSNYIVSSPNAIQPMIINGSGLLSHNDNVIHHHPGHQNVIQSSTNNKYWIANQSNVIATNNQFISNNSSGALLSPNNGRLVLNQLSNASYVIQQPQSFTTVDGQMVNVMNSENNGQFVQQTTQQRIILSPDSKRQTKKRKINSTSPQSISPQQSPTIQTSSPQTTVLQIAPHYHHHPQSQSFQTTIEQQILLQNGQTILQPLNLIGQQLLMPAGLMMTQDTVLQIQNMTPCGLIASQGMVQNKNYLSPNSSNQQFIMNGNGQISPIGQMYGTPVVIMPQANGFVQQTSMINNSVDSNPNNIQTQSITVSSTHTTPIQSVTSSPPDTTTHSPRSPERPESQRSNTSDVNMVQFVSSSEPDSNVSPIVDSAQSPSSDFERINNSYRTNIPSKPNEAKIRRLQTSTLQNMNHDYAIKMKPDSHESSSPSKKTAPANASNNVFSLGELVWGPVQGHNYWPGKIVTGPNDITAINTNTNNSTCYVQWFGRKSSIEMVQFASLKSLSDGLDAHHKAQKENRKGRKLNSQLEKAIQGAMIELDSMSSSQLKEPSVVSTEPTNSIVSTPVSSSKNIKTRATRASTAQQRNKLIKIAPAPPNSR